MKKLFYLLFFSLLISLAFANEKKCEKCVQHTPECKNSCEWIIEDEPPCNCGYNCPAKINNKCGWNFYLDASFICWQAKEEIDFNRYFFQDNLTPLHEVTDNLWSFNYHPGFKVGLGGYSSHDNWDFQIKYTWLKSKNINHISLDVSDVNSNLSKFLSPFWDTAGLIPLAPSNFQSAAIFAELAVLKINTNLIDGDVGRSYFVGTKLVFKPFIGLRGGWIDQKYDSTVSLYDQTNISLRAEGFARLKTDSWLIGPRIGLDSNWLLGSGFRFFGNTAMGLYYQKFSFSGRVFPIFQSQSPNSGIYNLYSSKKETHITPNVNCCLGLGWGAYLNGKKSLHVDFSASYDFEFFWSQNVLEKFASATDFYQVSRTSGDLMYHGLTVTAKMDF